MSKIILTTGGTGGHIFPALAVAKALKSLDPHSELLFIGSNYGPEAKLVAQAGLPFKGLEVRGFLGRGFRSFSAAFKMLNAIFWALKFMRHFKPDCVVGFGSYAAFAPMLAAQILGVPTVLHEQNAVAGSSNRYLGFRAKTICVTHKETLGFKSLKCVLTGNPVRKDLVLASSGAPLKSFDRKHLLILGGSQGAHALNQFVLANLEALNQAQILLYHQTGPKDLLEVEAAYAKFKGSKHRVSAFLDDMVEAYNWADLILCRSGASTVAELGVMGLPAVLVPFPHAIHDHQTLNAQGLVQKGAAILLKEEELSQPNSLDLILNLLQEPRRLKRMHEESLKLGEPEAAFKVANEIFLAIK
ncbi:MAG: undecaprenyldiphospho-muramoylpentapeptide beta-N-acetylglucosaminyltransferase [Desulfovibrionaceae bacterium]|nr:undecaprenyldiphospho-muramoylpentapeptide beta-N-acetylglucosaminyltransferase [Desulfovibrionaceae bacterium]